MIRPIRLAVPLTVLLLSACSPSSPPPAPAPTLPPPPAVRAPSGPRATPTQERFAKYLVDNRKYLGVGLVLTSEGKGKPGPTGYNDDYAVTIRVLAGRMRNGWDSPWTGPGEETFAVSYGGDVGIFGLPVTGSLVGFKEEAPCLIFEEVPAPAPESK